MIRRKINKNTFESRISKLEKMIHCKNESTGPFAVQLYEAVGEGDIRWKDIADAFLEICDENTCMKVCAMLELDEPEM